MRLSILWQQSIFIIEWRRYPLDMRHRIGLSLAGTLSFAAVHFAVAFTVGTLLTGSVVVGGALAPVEPACNTVACYFHE
jgi:hypothetical protein